MDLYREDYASFSAFLDRAENGKPSTSLGRKSRSQDSYYNDWSGGSWQSCLSDAKRGWQDGLERIARVAEPVLERIQQRAMLPELAYDIHGSDIDMGAFMTGRPDCFMQWEDSEVEAPFASGKIVHVGLNVATSAVFSKESMFKKGAAVAVLIDVLEATGRRVILDVGEAIEPTFGRRGTCAEIYIRVKNAEDHLNLGNLAFACAHSGMLRRLLFSVCECMPAEVVNSVGFYSGSGYGCPIELSQDANFDIYVGSSSSGMIRDPEAWAIEQLKQQGVSFADH